MERIYILNYTTKEEILSYTVDPYDNARIEDLLGEIRSIGTRRLLSFIARYHFIPSEQNDPHLYAQLYHDQKAKLVKWSSFKSGNRIQRMILYIK